MIYVTGVMPIAIAIAIGPIVQKYTPKYTANAQKNIPKTIAAPRGPARATRLGPRPQSGAAMVLGIFFCAFPVYFGVYFGVYLLKNGATCFHTTESYNQCRWPQGPGPSGTEWQVAI